MFFPYLNLFVATSNVGIVFLFPATWSAGTVTHSPIGRRDQARIRFPFPATSMTYCLVADVYRLGMAQIFLLPATPDTGGCLRFLFPVRRMRDSPPQFVWNTLFSRCGLDKKGLLLYFLNSMFFVIDKLIKDIFEDKFTIAKKVFLE